MKYNRKTKLLSFVLCMCMIIPMLTPILPVFSEGSSSDTSNSYSYGLHIGKVAEFNLNANYPFVFCNDPKTFDFDSNDSTSEHNSDKYWLRHTEAQFDFDKNLTWIVLNYYCDPASGQLWYQVKPAPGFDYPEKMQAENCTWIYQNNIKNYADGEIFRDPTKHPEADLDADNLLFSDPKSFITDANGIPVSSASVAKHQRVSLSASSSLQGSVNYQWQIKYDVDKDGNDLFVDIYGENKNTINVSFAMIHNLLDENGTALLRMKSYTLTSTAYETIPVSVSTVATTTAYALRAYATNNSNVELLDDATEGTDTDDNIVIIKVIFKYESGKQVQDDISIKLQKGSSYNGTIEIKSVLGYEVNYQEVAGGTYDEETKKLTINLENVTEDKTYTFTYVPADVEYKYDFWIKDITSDKYIQVKDANGNTVFSDPQTGKTDDKPSSFKDKVLPKNVEDIVGSKDGFVYIADDAEHSVITPDGKTVVSVYFEREYFLIKFDLDGGYGVQPIYARYGTPIDLEKLTPQKAGYVFLGWKDVTTEIPDKGSYTKTGKEIADPHEKYPTMVEKDQTFFAVFKLFPEYTTVTIVLWGENADDTNYSYGISESGETKFDLKSYNITVKIGTTLKYDEKTDTPICELYHIHDENCLSCGKEEHTHGTNCKYCTKSEHIHSAVGGSCYTLTCTIENHTHSTSCYVGVGTKQNVYIGPPSNPSNGLVTNHWRYGNLIYINDSWYEYSGTTASGSIAPTTCGKEENSHTHTNTCYVLSCTLEEHTHSSACCTLEEHTHNADCYSCGKEQHEHDEKCYFPKIHYDTAKWTFKESNTITVLDDTEKSKEGSHGNVINVKYDRVKYDVQFYSGSGNSEYEKNKINAKWGAFIGDKWPTVNNSSTWAINPSYDDNVDGPYQVYLQLMPVGGDKFYGPKTDSGTQSAFYYVEVLPGETGSETYGNGSYKLHHTDKSPGSGYVVTDDDKYAIAGFTYVGFTATRANSGRYYYNNAKFYYTRNSYILTFNNGESDESNVKNESVKFEASLSTFKDYDPEVPSYYESGSVVFAGWYQNPECTGEEYKLEDHNMPSHDIILYAKWVPVTHRVEIFKNQDDLNSGTHYKWEAKEDSGNVERPGDFTVNHGQKIQKIDIPPSDANTIDPNTNLKFVGWFNFETDERWDFENSTVDKDIKLYGKWTSDKGVKYTVIFVDENGTNVADPDEGYAFVGTQKGYNVIDVELYPEYKSGYYPDKNTDQITIGEDESENVITFTFTKADPVPYKVYYVTKEDPGNGQKTDAKGFEGYYDIAAPKDDTNEDNYCIVEEKHKPISGYLPDAQIKRLVLVPDSDENIIVFVYTKDDNAVQYKVEYYFQNKEGKYDHDSTLDFIGTGTVDGKLSAIYPQTWSKYPYHKFSKVDPEGEKELVRNEEENVFKVYYDYALTSLTIVKEGWKEIDPNQTFLFNVKGNGIDINVTVHGNGWVKIYGLTVGETYTITEIIDWSWRYEYGSYEADCNVTKVEESEIPNGAQFTIGVDGTVKFTNTRPMDQWLDGDSYCDNIFQKIN